MHTAAHTQPCICQHQPVSWHQAKSNTGPGSHPLQHLNYRVHSECKPCWLAHLCACSWLGSRALMAPAPATNRLQCPPWWPALPAVLQP
jgi:hypothetical protein